MAVQIIIGDCRTELAKLPDESVSCTLTSPPYGIGKDYERGVADSDWLSLQEAAIAQCIRVTSGSIVWQVGSKINDSACVPLDILIAPIFWDHGWVLRNRICWHTPAGLHSKHRFSGRHETALWFTRRGDNYTFNLDAVRVPQKYPGKKAFKGPKQGQLSGNPLGKNPGDVWEIPPVGHNNGERTGHPAQMPSEVVRRFLRALTKPGDTVLDPFAGSGTTGAVALELGRSAILIERDGDYAGIARNRIQRDAGTVAEIAS